MPDSHPASIRIPNKLYKKLLELCEKEKRSLSSQAVIIFEKYFEGKIK